MSPRVPGPWENQKSPKTTNPSRDKFHSKCSFLQVCDLDFCSRCRSKEVLVAQSCPTLCNSMDCSLSDSSIHGSLQERILEWVAMPFSRGSSQPSCWMLVSRIFLHWQMGSLPLVPPGKPLLYIENSKYMVYVVIKVKYKDYIRLENFFKSM